MGRINPLDGQRFAFLEGLKPSPPQLAKKDRPHPAIQFDDSIDTANEGPRPNFDDEISPF
jgi:hypothetical protein